MRCLQLIFVLAIGIGIDLTAVRAEGLETRGDEKAGQQKAATCVACHGEQGISRNELWPNIAGQKYQYLLLQLNAYKSGTRKNELMSGIAKMLSEQDIHDLAAYFSNLKSTAP